MNQIPCNIIAPKSPPKWWSTCMMSSWGLPNGGETTKVSAARGQSRHENRTLKKWLQIIKGTLSSELANWDLCAPIDLSAYQPKICAAPGTLMRIVGRIVQVDFRNDCATFIVHPNTKASLLNTYVDLLDGPFISEVTEAQKSILMIRFKRRLDELVVTTLCSALKWTFGPDGAGTLVHPGLEDSDDFDLHQGLDRVLGLGPYKGHGLAESIGALFENILPERGQYSGNFPDLLASALPSEEKFVDDEEFANAPIKRVRLCSRLKSATLQGNPPSSPPKRADIHEDERGGKKRGAPSSSGDKLQLSLAVEHTPRMVIEDGMRKKRKFSPDCHSTDSGIGLLSSPGESPRGSRRRSTTPIEDSMANDGLVSPGTSKRRNVEEWRNKTIIHANSCEESESSSEDEVSYPMHLPFQPLCAVERIVDTTLGLPLSPPPKPATTPQFTFQTYPFNWTTTVSPPALNGVEKHKSSAHKCRNWIRKQVTRESIVMDKDNDYTDKSDMELDSDTPTVELLVDSEDEDDHYKRKIRRRRRKALRKELGKKYYK